MEGREDGPAVGSRNARPIVIDDDFDAPVVSLQPHPRRFAVAEYSNSTPDSQETNMIRTFAELVTSGKIDPAWGDIALKTQQVVDACWQSARAEGKPLPVG